MSPQVSAERVFSLHRQFPDQWYDLHHPRSTARTIKFKINRSDFPPNTGNDLRIQHITLFLARKENVILEGRIDEIKLTQKAPTAPVTSNAAMTTLNGTVSTRQSGGAPLQSFTSGAVTPVGEWELTFAAGQSTTELFKEDEGGLDDILLVITWQSTAAPSRVS